MRDVSEQHAAKAALKGLLLSTSFDLRMSAQNVNTASELLASRRSVQNDQEAAFLATAVQSGCNALLFGVTSNVLEVRSAVIAAAQAHLTSYPRSYTSLSTASTPCPCAHSASLPPCEMCCRCVGFESLWR